MYKLLIVEDDQGISRGIMEQAQKWGLEVKCVEDFSDVLGEFKQFQPHIVLMDIMLPFFDGYHWCNEIRRISKAPIIFISSASDNMNIVMAMNMGGDDFIAKPFDLRALLDTLDSSLSYKDKKISLTKNEYRILLCLMENKGRVVSRETLMERLWETDLFVDENTLTVNVNRLRKKLDGAGLEDFISTRFGVGYIIKNTD